MNGVAGNCSTSSSARHLCGGKPTLGACTAVLTGSIKRQHAWQKSQSGCTGSEKLIEAASALLQAKAHCQCSLGELCAVHAPFGSSGAAKGIGKRQKAKGKRQKAKGKRQKAKGKRQKATPETGLKLEPVLQLLQYLKHARVCNMCTSIGSKATYS